MSFVHILYEFSSYLKNRKSQQNVIESEKKLKYYLLFDVIRSTAHT